MSEGANDPFSILPRHIAARYASLDHSSLDADPVGLGPFVVTRWQRGARLEFARNPTLQLRATTTNIVDYLQFNLHSPLLRDPVLRRPSTRPPRGALLRGRSVALDLAIASHWRNSARAAVALAGDLAAVGITANIRGYTEAVFWAPKDAGGTTKLGVRARTSREPARRTIATRETG